MSKLDGDIERATKDFNYYLRKRQKYLDNPKKLAYYSEILITKEEKLVRLLNKSKIRKQTTKG